jgi:hypothetical protein
MAALWWLASRKGKRIKSSLKNLIIACSEGVNFGNIDHAFSEIMEPIPYPTNDFPRSTLARI